MNKTLLLFIHGLGGNAKETWGEFPNLIGKDNSLHDNFEIGFYQYPTSLFRFPFSRKMPQIQTLASGLRTQINNQFSQYNSIILICHSLGGLIARQYLVEELKNNRPLRIDKLLLYAVPNNGAGLASIAEHVSWMHSQLAQLCTHSEFIRFLNEEWIREKVGEKVKIKYVVAALDRVVNEESAKGFWENQNVEMIVDKGHINVVKPQSSDDLAFLILKNFVLTSIENVSIYETRAKVEPSLEVPSLALECLHQPESLSSIWNVPHHRNPNFTGREELLQNLRAALASEQSAALTQAIHGLGGVGKTQLAVEYAYRFSHEYEAVWWLAAESPATLAADYAALAQPLALPEKEATDQNLAIAAVRHWLNHHDGWLLVFDNAPEVEALHDYLPQATTGHVLITSRNPNWRSLAQPFAVSTFAPEEAIDFLCKRTGQTDRDAAAKLTEALGHLPLALTQAAAYIEETGKSVSDYLALYQQHRQKLLARAKPSADYRFTVATTWELSFQAVQLQCATATDLLHLCAFLAPEEIPWDLLQPALSEVEQLKTSALADPLESDAAVAVLRRYSLVEVKDQSLSLHRLVQQVIQDRLPEAERTRWQERAVLLVAETFPARENNPADVRTWPVCRRLLAHALLLSETQIVPVWVALLCNQVGVYLGARANYSEAEPLYRRSLEIREQQLGPEHPEVAASLNNLAELLRSQGKFVEAEPLYRRSLETWGQQLGQEHPAVATGLNNLAALLVSQGKHVEAVPLYRRSLEIREKQLGPEHPDVAQSLNNLAELLRSQGKSAEAEPLYHRSLEIREQQLGPEHPAVANSLNNLARLLESQGKFAEAEPLFRRSLAICEKTLGPEHPNTQLVRKNLTLLLEVMRGK